MSEENGEQEELKNNDRQLSVCVTILLLPGAEGGGAGGRSLLELLRCALFERTFLHFDCSL